MTEQEQLDAIRKFADEWRNRGNERSEYQIFWLTLFRDVYGIDKPEKIIKFECPVDVNGTIHRIDALIPSTKVLIEQKSFGTDLTDAFDQAKRYADALDYSQRPRWIVVCNFQEFHIYDNTRLIEFNYEPKIIKLEELDYEYKSLNSLVDPNDDSLKWEVTISKDAATIIKTVYNICAEYYKKSGSAYFKDALCKLCVRMAFCLYAEDSHVFNEKQFSNYLKNLNGENFNEVLPNLFSALNQKKEERDENIDAELNNFPYVNGGLFEENIPLPQFDKDFSTKILRAFVLPQDKGYKEFSWHLIEPSIFGAMFESVISDDKRRAGGMHYTSVENIHKVIDPLFMDDLDAEFRTLKHSRQNKIQRLQEFQNKLASLTFLDPACGSGNFLTETYLSLRRLENDVLRELMKIADSSGDYSIIPKEPVKVKISQFYGIEINDFAVAVAQVALWIAENQMLQETVMATGKILKELPLENYATIRKDNALRIDWDTVVPRDNLTYIIGNPPFVGYTYQTAQQRADLLAATHLNTRKIDYVVSWYYKAAEFIQDTNIRCAFVSTNSITQGEQVAVVWKPLLEKIHIDFAYRTFKWTSESDGMAAVHCVIIGFSCCKNRKRKIIFDGNETITAQNINPYLIDAENILIKSRRTPLCDVPHIVYGNKLVEDGNLIIEDDDYMDFIAKEPRAKKYIKRLIGSDSFINNKIRHCLWLVDVPLEEIIKMPLVVERIDKVIRFRLSSTKAETQSDANRPTVFQEIRQPLSNYIVVPRISSERRRYIPMGFLPADVIVTDGVQIIPDATIYHFGVLTSIVHMAWTRAVCGRLEMRYRYSNSIVYNNFVWCTPPPAQKLLIEATAQRILSVRARYEGYSLAWMYDDKTMPSDLREAHLENDRAVMEAYGFRADMTEAEIVAALMKMYQALTGS